MFKYFWMIPIILLAIIWTIVSIIDTVAWITSHFKDRFYWQSLDELTITYWAIVFSIIGMFSFWDWIEYMMSK